MQNGNQYQQIFYQADYRYIQYYFSFIATHSSQFSHLLSEHNNILSALTATNVYDDLQELSLETTIYLHEYMLQQGHWQIWSEIIQKAVQVSREFANHGRVIALLLQLVELLINFGDYETAKKQLDLAIHLLTLGNIETKYVAQIKYYQSRLALRNGKYQLAVGFLKEGLKILEPSDLVLRGLFSSHLGNLYRLIGDIPAAFCSLKEAETIFQSQKEKRHLGGVLNTYGLVYQSMGDYEKATYYFMKAIALFEASGDRASFAMVHKNVGCAFWATNKMQEAIPYTNEAIKLAKEMGYQLLLAGAYGDLGIIYMDLGESQKSLHYIQQQIQLCTEIKDKIEYGRGIGNLGTAFYAFGRFEEALDCLILEKEHLLSSDSESAIYRLAYEGLVHYELGNRQASLTAVKTALSISQKKGYKALEIMALRGMAKLYPKRAKTYLHQALSLAEKLGKALEQGICKFELGILEEDMSKGYIFLEESYLIFQRLGSKLWLYKAQNRLNQIQLFERVVI